MDFSRFGSDILLVHLVPLLSEPTIRSLAGTNKALFELLGPFRFQKTAVYTSAGCILFSLTPSTLRTINHLVFNGTERHHDMIFGCPDLGAVVSATIIVRIAEHQRTAFGKWAERLIELTEEQNPWDDDETTSSFSDLPAGSIKNLHHLRLFISLPNQLGTLLSVAENLARIEYVPDFSEWAIEEYQQYSQDLKKLLVLLRDQKMLPSLRLVRVAPDQVIGPEGLPIRSDILKALWRAMFSHGGWKLLAQKPSTGQQVDFPAAWASWWTDRAWDFFITTEEFETFAIGCQRRKIYPRLDQFISGRVHIQIFDTSAQLGTLMQTVVYGVCIDHNARNDMTASLKVVTKDTRALSITLEEYSGPMCRNNPNSTPYHGVEALVIEGPNARPSQDRIPYLLNISAGLVKTMAVQEWRNIVNLSLPASAFEKVPVNGFSSEMDYAACQRHIGSYDLEWLASCQTLKAIQITAWAGCQSCALEEEVSLEGGLRHLPPSIAFVLIGGYIACPDPLRVFWKHAVYSAIMDGLRGKGAGLVVNLGRLRIGR